MWTWQGNRLKLIIVLSAEAKSPQNIIARVGGGKGAMAALLLAAANMLMPVSDEDYEDHHHQDHQNHHHHHHHQHHHHHHQPSPHLGTCRLAMLEDQLDPLGKIGKTMCTMFNVYTTHMYIKK